MLYSRPELLDHIEVEPNQVSVNYATQIRPVSKRSGRNIQAVVAGEVGSVNTEYVLYAFSIDLVGFLRNAI